MTTTREIVLLQEKNGYYKRERLCAIGERNILQEKTEHYREV